MSVLAVIPARLGSTRLSRKPLRLIAGAPLVTRVLDQVRRLSVASHVVVATDSPEIAEVVSAHGGQAVMTRPDHPSGTDRVAEVGRMAEHRQYDIVLNVQGDEPFVSAEALSGALSMVQSGFALGTVAARAEADVLRDPDVVKAVRADDGRAMYFSRAPIPWLRDAADAGAQSGLVLQHIGVYAYTREALQQWVILPPHPLELCERLEQLRPLAAGMTMGVAVLDHAPPRGVDTEADLVSANVRWHDLYAGRN